MRKRLHLIATFGLIALCLHLNSLAATLTWTGEASTDFYNTNNWSPKAAPAAGDTLNLGTGVVNISSPFTSTGRINWTSGNLWGVLTIGSSGLLSISGTATKTLFGEVTSAGTITLASDLGFGQYNVQVINQGGAVFDVQGDYSIMNTYGFGQSANQQIVNAGTFRKSAGSGSAAVTGISFLNTGTVEALSGTLALQAGGMLAGTCTASGGAAVTLNCGGFDNFELLPSAVFNGAGFVGVNGGIPSFSGMLSTTMGWTAGSIRGTWTVGSGGAILVSGAGTKSLQGTLTNFGTITLASGLGFGEYNVQVINQAGAKFDVQGDYTINSTYGSGQQIVNAGTFRKSAGSGSAAVTGISFLNTGTVEAQNGRISFTAPLVNTGGGFAVRLNNAAEWGRLVFSGSLKLDGPFSVAVLPGFTPALGSSFQVLSFPSAAGNVTAFQGLDLGGGLKLVPELTRSALNLKVDAYPVGWPPVLSTYRVPKALLVWWPEAYTNYQAEVATNLTAPAWQPVPVTSPNQVLRSPDLPQEYFRLVKQ